MEITAKDIAKDLTEEITVEISKDSKDPQESVSLLQTCTFDYFFYLQNTGIVIQV